MAKSLESHRSDIRTSIHGRRIGLTHDDYLVGQKEFKRAVTNATSDTTGTNIPNYGFHTVVTTTNDTWTLDDPTPDTEVTIATNSTSTGNHVVLPDNATIVSTNGVAGSSMILQGIGACARLIGISTAQWLLTSRGGSTTAGATVAVSS